MYVFRLSDAEILPPYRVYDYKIELLLKEISFNNKVKVILSKNLLTVKTYINKYFDKSFININTVFTVTLILLIKKLKKNICIYVNYKSLNNVTV